MGASLLAPTSQQRAVSVSLRKKEVAAAGAIRLKMFLNFITVLSIFVSINCSSDVKHRNLLHFETLHLTDLKHHVMKRDVLTDKPSHRQLDFTSHGSTIYHWYHTTEVFRQFKLILRKDTSILADNFEAFAVNGEDKHTQISFDHEIYRGYDANEPDTSWVSAYWDETGLVSSAVHVLNDTYVIEPASGHLPPSDNYTHISYRSSDIVVSDDKNQFCTSSIDQLESRGVHSAEHRTKRSSDDPKCADVVKNRKLCPVLLVADYNFFKLVGGSSNSSTQRFLINQMERINKIYQEQEFGDCGNGFGFVIKEIDIQHIENTNSSASLSHNMDELLRKFTSGGRNRRRYENFCAVHLFTAKYFGGSVLGNAWVAKPDDADYSSSGGICSPCNTGITNYLDAEKAILLSQQAMLITAHGHNWGAVHDTGRCAPSDSAGGKYIMYMYQGLGFERNNKIFSLCSKQGIAQVLRDRAVKCFQEETPKTGCGNFMLDKNEECDEGPAGNSGRCCRADCTLKSESQCSDANHECCEKCKFASTGKICSDGGSCKANSYCDGNSSNCPEAMNQPNGSLCHWGVCFDGQCSSKCSYHNKTHCSCDNVEDSCKWCCIDNDGKCTPLSGSNNTLPPGYPCIYGRCNNESRCEYHEPSSLSKLWKAILDIGKTPLADFLRANIVGTVLFLSTVVWVPVSLALHRLDRRLRESQQAMEQWQDISNNELVTEDDRERVRSSVKVFHVRDRHRSADL